FQGRGNREKEALEERIGCGTGDARLGQLVQLSSPARAAGLCSTSGVRGGIHPESGSAEGSVTQEPEPPEIPGRFKAAERIDREEDALDGEGVLGDELPEELRRSEQRRKKSREAKAALEAEARASRERSEEGESQEGDDDADGDAGGASPL